MRNVRVTRQIASANKSKPRVIFLTVLILTLTVSAVAKMYEAPRSFALNDKSQDQADRKVLPNIDAARLLAEDAARGKLRPGPRRFAVAVNSSYSLTNSGTWQNLPDGRLWMLHFQSP